MYCALSIDEWITPFLKDFLTITMESQQQLLIIPIQFYLVIENSFVFLKQIFYGVVHEQYQFH